MTYDILTIRRAYFRWLYEKVGPKRGIPQDRSLKILTILHGIQFRYTLYMDKNRAADGINLRSRYIREAAYLNADEIVAYLDGPCSVLEMLVALSLRVEEQIMTDLYSDEPGRWFWIMVENLGIINTSDDEIRDKVDVFLDRRYAPDGTGNIIKLRRPPQDLRTSEIWYQINWYLEECEQN